MHQLPRRRGRSRHLRRVEEEYPCRQECGLLRLPQGQARRESRLRAPWRLYSGDRHPQHLRQLPCRRGGAAAAFAPRQGWQYSGLAGQSAGRGDWWTGRRQCRLSAMTLQTAGIDGCQQCHGSTVVLDDKGRPTPQTWPNTGIGRINPDGSLGSCSACHARHSFSSAQARTPDTCGKCHLGPDHPQLEIYNESKHGILYRAKIKEMNLDSKKWVVGVDYTAAPTCATCHMSATREQKVTHDVGERISWTLRPAVSTKLNMIRLSTGDEFDQPEGKPLPKVGDEVKGAKVTQVLTWTERRDKMKDVCVACHSANTVAGQYKQFDDLVELYNDKYAKPIAAVMKELEDKGYLTHQPMDAKIKWTWFEIWHHEGRRARHGAAMNGPDYTWWHGIYEVSQHTYFKWIPELKEVVRQKDGNEDFANALLDKHFKPIRSEEWFFNGMGKDAIEKVRKGYDERYGKGALK